MLRFTAALLVALSLPFAAHADDTSHRAKAREMMALLHTEQMVDNISTGLKKQLPDAANTVIGQSPTPAQKNDAANFVKQSDATIDAQLSWAALEPAFIDIYVKNFTEEQMDGIIAFYKSPAGLAMLTTMPTINSQVQKYGDQKIADLKPMIQKLYESFRTADGTAAPAAAAAPHSSAPSPIAPK